MFQLLLDKQRLISCREKLGITKLEAARRMNMSQAAYVRYESGIRMPSLHVINTMANILNTSAEYLTGQTNIASPTSYIISSQIDPELFHVVETYKNSDEARKERLLEYFTSLPKYSYSIQ